MAFIKSFLNRSLSIFLLLFFHLGCFSLNFSNNPDHQPPSKRRRITPSISPSSTSASNLNPPHKSLTSSIFFYLNRFLSFRHPQQPPPHHHQPSPPPPYLNSLSLSPDLTTSNKSPAVSPPPPPVSTNHSSSAPRADIFPCSTCGEVLARPQLHELHQATRHSLTELRDGDSGKNIVQIIFHSGWRGESSPVIHRILKIHNTPKTLARFEEYREIVRSRAARTRGRTDERCLADGNERLRFYCSTILCADVAGPLSGVCGSPYCSTCGIVRHGFAGKQADLDGIATHATGWGSHVSLPDELEREFAFLHVRRAMLVCRVVAGRVARGGEEAEEEKKGSAFDSVVPVGRQVASREEEQEELLVFNPRAVLPCFVIIYSM